MVDQARSGVMASEAQFFETAAQWRAWLKRHHRTAGELHVGYWNARAVAKGRVCMSWKESVREALCFGWIDGVRRRLGAQTYVIRFTPRRAKSTWSAINIRLVRELEAAGLMMEAGRAAFEARPHKTGSKAGGYTYRERYASLPLSGELVREFKRAKAAWAFFERQPPGYRRMVSWWVMSAKKEETRARRFAKLVGWSGRGKRL